MQSFMSRLNRVKNWVGSKAAAVVNWFKVHGEDIINVATVIAFTFGIVVLLLLVWFYVRPVKTADIKVPVATDQASYYPGQPVSGIFFGDTYYNGEVRILREVFCKNYKGFIKPPEGNGAGNFFSTQARPRHLEGVTVPIGNLPSDVPVGSNCVLQFTNVYDIQTPFGIRHIEYQYYTQNFAIVTKERRDQLDCEASGEKDCNFIGETESNSAAAPAQVPQSSPETAPSAAQPSVNYNSTTNNSTTNNTTTNEAPMPTEPAPRYVERCTVNALGIKIGCRQVEVN